jgi:4-amino-4-deoxy-L-arabinose transferase-like glycosyltransferase
MGFVAFSLIGGKRWYYLLPIFPPVALLAARGLIVWIEAPSGRLARTTTVVFLVLSGIMAVGIPGFVLYCELNFDIPLIAPLLWSLVVLALAVAFLVLVQRGVRARAAWSLLLAVSALWVTYRHTLWPLEIRNKSSRELVRWITETVGEEETLRVFQTNATEMRFYLDRQVIKLDNRAELHAELRAVDTQPLWVIIDSDETKDLGEFTWSLAAEEIDGRAWDDFNFALVRVTGSASRESTDHRR